ncbi:TOBE domain-containing protein [Desulfosarcina sp.]|uniref:TOBE domain-containing protein n=1 Tax=Desulfosarcina sp. TaxID=2027861 RepID=UPI0039708F37
MKPKTRRTGSQPSQSVTLTGEGRLSPIFATQAKGKYLDATQLHRLEQSFREWVGATPRSDVHFARQRILLIFLIIRHTGVKLNEVLSLDPIQDIDFDLKIIKIVDSQDDMDHPRRTVQLSEELCKEIHAMISGTLQGDAAKNLFRVDPGFVRKKFYERAEACGFAKQLGAPENLRKSRGVELIQNNLPLPAVQMMLGHSTPNLTSSYVSFSQDDIQQTIRLFIEKESAHKTSARNSFFGKVEATKQGDIQTQVTLVTLGGCRLTTVITNDSLHHLGLKVGKVVTAEVKAPWVILQKPGKDVSTSSENILSGVVERINQGKINTEFLVRLPDGTAVCSIISSESAKRLALASGDQVCALFNAYSVVLLSG